MIHHERATLQQADKGGNAEDTDRLCWVSVALKALSFYHIIQKHVVVEHAAGGWQSWSVVFHNSFFSVRFLQGMSHWEIIAWWASQNIKLRVLEAGSFGQCEHKCAVFVELVRVHLIRVEDAAIVSFFQ